MYLSAECALRCTLNRFSFSLYLMRVKNLGNVKCKLKSFATLSGSSFFYFLLLLYISSNTISCCTATNRACLLLFHFSLLLFIIFNLAFKFVCLSFARGKSSTYVVLLWIYTNDRTIIRCNAFAKAGGFTSHWCFILPMEILELGTLFPCISVRLFRVWASSFVIFVFFEPLHSVSCVYFFGFKCLCRRKFHW